MDCQAEGKLGMVACLPNWCFSASGASSRSCLMCPWPALKLSLLDNWRMSCIDELLALHCTTGMLPIGAGPIFYLKNSEISGKYSLGINTSFATMSDPPTPNLGFLVHATMHYTLLTISYTLNTAHTTLHLSYFAFNCSFGYSIALSHGYC